MAFGIGRALKRAGRKIEKQLKRSAPDIATGGLTMALREGAKILTPEINLPGQEPVIAMPTPDDEELQRARRRSLISQRQRSGRQSTMLSTGYSGETLG